MNQNSSTKKFDILEELAKLPIQEKQDCAYCELATDIHELDFCPSCGKLL